MAGRSKVETALYESFVKGEINRPQQIKPGKMGLTQSIQVRGQQDDGGATQLVRALSSISGELQQYSAKETDRNINIQQEEAQKKYLSMTMDERKVMAESGQLGQYDPVYSAMFSRLWGEDISRNTSDEVINKVRTGELKFGSNEELNKYLEDRRKTDLTNYGGNEYALAGYDHHFTKMRREATNINSYMRGHEKRQNDLQLVQSQLIGVAKDTDASPQALATTYQKLQATGHFTDLEMHQKMGEVAQSLARQGKTKQLEALLGTQFSRDKEFGNFGAFLGDNADVLTKTAKAENEKQRKEAFEGTYANLLQSATEGKLNSFIGGRRADVNSVYAYLEKNGVKDVYSPEQVAGLVNHHNNALERQRAEAERNLMKQQLASIKAQAEASSREEFLRGGRPAMTDKTTVGPNGEIRVIDADTAYKKVATQFNNDIDQQVAKGLLTPKQAFDKKLSIYGNGGTNPQWVDQLKFGMQAAPMAAADPNNKQARQAFETAVATYGELKKSNMPGIASLHTSGKERDLLNLAVAAQSRGQDPLMIVSRAMNTESEVNIPHKDVAKLVKDERLQADVYSTATMYARGLGMPVKDAIKLAADDLKDKYLKVGGSMVQPITRNLPVERQEEAIGRIVSKTVAPLGFDASAVSLDTFNPASGFYTLRHKNGFAPVLDAKGKPLVITKDSLFAESKLIDDEYLAKNTTKAIPTDRGKGFKQGKPIDLSSNYGLGEVKMPSFEIPEVNFKDAAPNIGVPRNKR